MKTAIEQQAIEQEVCRIAADIIYHARHDAKGLYWITPAPNKHSKEGESIDLFNGSAGIILFLLSLYKYKPDQRYLDVCITAANRLLQHAEVQNPRYYTFYGGASGVLYVCIQLYKATGDATYIEKALQLEKIYRQSFDTRVNQHDLLSGQAGILLAIAHLYACTLDDSLLPAIETSIKKLVNGAHISTAGLKWDTLKHGYDSLTGFSHGGSGIAFALFQVGHYFNASGLLYLASQALLHESNYFEAATGNYMDLRVGMERMQTIRQQYSKDLAAWPLFIFQPTMSNISSWAHGAAGCALARLFAFEITGDQQYAQQACHALEYSWAYFKKQQQPDYSLCSGYGGIAAIFEQAARMLKQPLWKARSMHIAMTAIDYYKKQHTYNSKVDHSIPDYGLFSGLAGVGYWLLGCLTPHAPDSILHPSLVPDKAANTQNLKIAALYSTSSVKEIIFNRYYSQTLSRIANYKKETANAICQKALDIHELDRSLQAYINDQNGTISDLYTDYKREKQIAALWQQHKGFLQFRQRRLQLQILINDYMQLCDEDWLKLELITANHIVITDENNDHKRMLYYCHEAGISSLRVTGFTALLLRAFKQQQTVAAVMAAIEQQPFIDAGRININQAVIKQVKELVKAGFLIASRLN
jgi:hypothetical protein